MQEKPLILDCAQGDSIAQYFPRPSLLSSHQAQWNGMYLEFQCQPPMEVPEYSYQQHIITIPTRYGVEVEEIVEGKTQATSFQAGDINVAPLSLPRRYRWQQEFEGIHLILEPELINYAAPELVDPDIIELVPHFIQADPLIHQIAIALKTELERNGSGSKLYAESAATFLAVHLLQHYSTVKPCCQRQEGGLSHCKLKQAVDYIHDHLAEEICLDELAGYLGLSRYYFCRLFKQSTGLSPYQYVIQCRVERAKYLLKKGDLSLADISVACGFTHQSHLHRHFKRLTGVTPKQFLSL
ncbi:MULTISPECIES: helix-turn-helix transcriptional regulator [unclassified Coleofasciculus]|uniref:helix-turn-helix transcriptional regulator n=1 Tax=unclassified Coleofasciculus TaxID=2692782 RepID=UPI00188231AF|nr:MULTISPECIES: AraC family transcriptional regulator [unclassified Coleofasciculus]MBE9128374.1 helix-turn-helix transcriptional regulator [Coleofasciculus sp. LEGE 07081]MBE9151430.1 helix-turn-helix transcriptional regulator [Coleofasciculus sp. LEGE 07092]